MANEQKIWSFLSEKIGNPFGAAGLMGNLYAESALNPKNLEQLYEKKYGFTDDSYTAAVDDGTYNNFCTDSAGYGLAQWTYRTRKAALMNYAHAQRASIGDLDMQLGFLWKELSESYPGVLSTLKTATSVRAASDVVMVKFENPANQSETAKAGRAKFGQAYYDKFANVGTEKPSATMTEAELRGLVVALAKSWLGRNERDGSHRLIIDIYNSHKPLARGWKMPYSGNNSAWCATFVSAVSIKLGLTDIIPPECGCEEQIKLFKKLGRWEENDAYVPKPGDVIYYDWQDSGVGDNRGEADHVGYVEKVENGVIYAIEGNKNDSVEPRPIPVDGKFIRGFGIPDYAGKAAKMKKEDNDMAKIYADIKDVPSYWRDDIQELLDMDCINGGTPREKNATDVNLSEDVIKAIVIMKRYVDKKYGKK